MAVHKVPLKKAKGKFVEVHTDKEHINGETYAYIFQMGLKAIINRGTTNLKRENFGPDDAGYAAYEAEAIKIAEKQVADMYAGKTRMVGAGPTAKGGKKSAEHTEAIRLAKIYARQQAKDRGEKVSLISAKTWTETAEAYIAADPDTWYAAARESLAKTKVNPVKGTDIHPTADPELVRKAEAKAAAAKAAKDAKTAGKTAAPPPPKKGEGKGKGKPTQHA